MLGCDSPESPIYCLPLVCTHKSMQTTTFSESLCPNHTMLHWQRHILYTWWCVAQIFSRRTIAKATIYINLLTSKTLHIPSTCMSWAIFKIQVVTRNFENYWWQLKTIDCITHQFWSPKSTSVCILFAGVFAAFLPPLPWDVRPPATWRTKVRAHSMAPR